MARVRQHRWHERAPRPDSLPSRDEGCAISPDSTKPLDIAPVIDIDMSNWRAEGRRISDQSCASWSDFLQACEASGDFPAQPEPEERAPKRRRIEDKGQSTTRALITTAPVEGFLILGSFDVTIVGRGFSPMI